MKIFPVYYFPPVSWFAAVSKETSVVLELNQFYRKQQYHNRMRIKGANKVEILSLPVTRDGEHVPFKNKIVSYDFDWQKNHWKSLEAAYRSSPFFEYYEDQIESVFNSKIDSLSEICIHSTNILAKALKIETQFSFTEEYFPSDHYEKDFRESFRSSGASPDWFRGEPYPQVFEEFSPDLSAIDLICNLGPEAGEFLKRCIHEERFLQASSHITS